MGRPVSLRWFAVLVPLCVAGAYAAYLSVKPPPPLDWPALRPDNAALRLQGGEVPSSAVSSHGPVQPATAPAEWSPEATAGNPPESDLGSLHPGVRRMTTEARLVGSFGSCQGAGPTTRRPLAGQDLASSAVMPFGPAPVEPVPAAAKDRPTQFDPMQANPTLAAMTQQAQRDLTAIVESLKAVEGGGRP